MKAIPYTGKHHRYFVVATNWFLWNEYVNTYAAMTRAEFDALTVGERIALQIEIFGPDTESRDIFKCAARDCDGCTACTPNPESAT